MFRPAVSSLKQASRASIRSYSSAPAAGGNEFMAQRAAVKAHASETTDLWKKISFYVCIPGIIVGSLWTWKVEQEHASHIEHIKHDNGGELPERHVYSYMNIRNKPFPWGMTSLFFNPEANIPVESE